MKAIAQRCVLPSTSLSPNHLPDLPCWEVALFKHPDLFQPVWEELFPWLSVRQLERAPGEVQKGVHLRQMLSEEELHLEHHPRSVYWHYCNERYLFPVS